MKMTRTKVRYLLTLLLLVTGSHYTIGQVACENFPSSMGYTAIPEQPGGDPSNTYNVVNLGFDFNYYGDYHSTVLISPSGFVTFDSTLANTYAALDPPFSVPVTGQIIAPFWAKVALSPTNTGDGWVYYKVFSDHISIIWEQVQFNLQDDSNNTFELILGNSTYRQQYGYNVVFKYFYMEWTTGGAGNGYGTPESFTGFNKKKSGGECIVKEIARYNDSSVGSLSGTCQSFDTSVQNGITADFDWQDNLCVFDFNDTITNPEAWDIVGALWEFGDGSSSTQSNPFHSYENDGEYDVSFTLTYDNGCAQQSLEIEKTVSIESNQDFISDTLLQSSEILLDSVINSSLVSFSDAWLLDPSTSSDWSNGFATGQEGVWRQQNAYAYHEDRSQSNALNLSRDGTYPLSLPDQRHVQLLHSSKWINSRSSTRYLANSNLVEQKNALDIYSAEVYDHNDFLVTATGVNMKSSEVAFTSFEENTGRSGNFTFSNSQNVPGNVFSVVGNGKFLIIDQPRQTVDHFESLSLAVDNFGGSPKQFEYFKNQTIGCRLTHPQDSSKTIIVLEQEPKSGIWTGTVQSSQDPIDTVNIELDSLAHAGKLSMKITAITELNQQLLSLVPMREYSVMAWISIGDEHLMTPFLGQGIMITAKAYGFTGELIGSFDFYSAGPVVEGWQQVKGSFIYPANAKYLSLSFNPGDQPAIWIDDIRLFPTRGNMKAFVYDLENYRLSASLDEENWTTFFHYDEEGNLFTTQVETEKGIKTIAENISYIKEQ